VNKLDFKLQKGPVQLTVLLEATRGLNLVQVLDSQGNTWFYRLVTESEVIINLPIHPEDVIIVSVNAPILSILQARLIPPKISYVYPPDAKRPYNWSEIKYIPNPIMNGPARMFTDRPLVEYNPAQLATMSEPVKRFVLIHEHGHNYHDEEHKTDAWALVTFLNQGWGLSSAIYALLHVLKRSDENVYRIIHQNELIKQIAKRYYA
jgi:hypothetical protein